MFINTYLCIYIQEVRLLLNQLISTLHITTNITNNKKIQLYIFMYISINKDNYPFIGPVKLIRLDKNQLALRIDK